MYVHLSAHSPSDISPFLRFLHITACEQVVTACDLNGSHGPPVTTDVNLKGVHERTQRVMYFYGRRSGQW